MILLTFEMPLPQLLLQESWANCGFGPEIRQMLRENYKIETELKIFGEDFGGFRTAALEAVKAGGFPIVTLPSFAHYDSEAGGMALALHTYMAFEEHGEISFVGPKQGYGNPEHLSSQEFDLRRAHWAAFLKAVNFNGRPFPVKEMLPSLFPREYA